MPNITTNRIEMEGIGGLPLFSTQKGHVDFDFNKLIPMPDSLNIESGSMTDESIMYYLTERCTIPLSCLEEEKIELIQATNRLFSTKQWLQTVFERAMESTYKASEDRKNKMYQMGKTYIDNYKKYGATTWYDWCCKNWGTKWNAFNTVIETDAVEFQTAWCHPHPVLLELSSQYPDKEIVLTYQDEDDDTEYTVVYSKGDVVPEFS